MPRPPRLSAAFVCTTECRCRTLAVACLIAHVATTGATPASAQPSLIGHVGAEARFFFQDPLAPAQPRGASTSAKLQPELTLTLGERVILRGIALARVDQSDSKRSYVDLREALVQWDHGPLTARVGVSTVFWGVTESRHLVNVINQTDYLDDLDGDERLGQLMAHLSYDAGSLGLTDLFVMSWARPQMYPGEGGRPGVPFPVLDDTPVYESGHDEWNVDVALRWSHSIGEVYGAASYFQGTAREPELAPTETGVRQALLPRYDLIRQAGLELQWTTGDWLWKAEGIVRSGQGPTFAAVTGGLEQTTVAVLGSALDLGAILEYSYDGRDNLTYNIHDNDVFGGFRLSFNDVQGSELLAGVLQDLESDVTLGTVEASRRLGEGWRLELIARLFRAGVDEDPVYWFRRDDYLQTVVEYHF